MQKLSLNGVQYDEIAMKTHRVFICPIRFCNQHVQMISTYLSQNTATTRLDASWLVSVLPIWIIRWTRHISLKRVSLSPLYGGEQKSQNIEIYSTSCS